jgi:hypothetical protein
MTVKGRADLTLNSFSKTSDNMLVDVSYNEIIGNVLHRDKNSVAA